MWLRKINDLYFWRYIGSAFLRRGTSSLKVVLVVNIEIGLSYLDFETMSCFPWYYMVNIRGNRCTFIISFCCPMVTHFLTAFLFCLFAFRIVFCCYACSILHFFGAVFNALFHLIFVV